VLDVAAVVPLHVPYRVLLPLRGQEGVFSPPGLAEFTKSWTFGCAARPVDVAAQSSCAARQGLVVVGRPLFTPTTPNACREGNGPAAELVGEAHCG
jgi:hypothetical protein